MSNDKLGNYHPKNLVTGAATPRKVEIFYCCTVPSNLIGRLS